MPKLSPTMEGGTLIKWHKSEGDFVKEGDLLFEVATDKATVEYNALDEGFLRKIIIFEGQDAKVNQPVAIFTETKDESIEGFIKEEPIKEAAPSPSDEETPKETKEVPLSTSLQQTAFSPQPPIENYTFEFPEGTLDGAVFASPLAKKLAREKGIDLSTIKGSGPNGRIMSRDFDLAVKDTPATFGKRDLPKISPGSYVEEALSPLRKIIGEKLQAAKTFIPHFYVQQEVNVKALLEARKELKSFGINITLNDFIVRAVALSLKEHPVINSGYNSADNKIIRFKTIDIAIAVSIPDGLITPIIRFADYKNLGQLSVEIRKLATLAKSLKLEKEQYTGGSFTISNLGMYGINDFQAVINPPQAAILAVGGIKDQPVIENGEIAAGKILTLSLSSDHRVIDGADAAKFIKTVQKFLENPSVLIV